MQTTHTKPFKVTRVPAINGEWIDLHLSASGQNVCIDTSGYAEVDIKELIEVLKSLSTD